MIPAIPVVLPCCRPLVLVVLVVLFVLLVLLVLVLIPCFLCGRQERNNVREDVRTVAARARRRRRATRSICRPRDRSAGLRERTWSKDSLPRAASFLVVLPPVFRKRPPQPSAPAENASSHARQPHPALFYHEGAGANSWGQSATRTAEMRGSPSSRCTR